MSHLLALFFCSIQFAGAVAPGPSVGFGELSPADLTDAKQVGPEDASNQASGFAPIIPDLRAAVGAAAHLGGLEAPPATRRSGGARVYERLASSVVLIANFGSSSRLEILGSGTLVSDTGEVLTNWHVVKNHDRAQVYLRPPNGEAPSESYLAKVEKVDEQADLALLKLVAPPSALTTASLAGSDQVQIGDVVHAIGHPGQAYWTYTKGYISQLRNRYSWLQKHEAAVIQVQTPVDPGSSGSPLFDEAGGLIGINSFRDERTPGQGFAVAVSEIRRFISDKAKGSISAKAASLQAGSNELVAFDRNEDGAADAWVLDKDGDGRLEVAFFDVDWNGTVDAAIADLDQNDKVEAEGRDTNGNGKIDTWYIDHDEDGTVDEVGFDLDEDGEIERFERSLGG